MRIGELAALVGVSTRTVRHYHQLGLLPEPARTAGGYRDYRLRDAVLLARVRRLAELGLSLDEIRDVLADDRGRDLREVLLELDSDLARQQELIAARRVRLAALLEEGELRADSAVSPDMAAVLRDLDTEGSTFAEMDREMLTLMDTVADPGMRDEIVELMRPLAEPGMRERAHELYRRLDGLADAEPGDPRVRELAADLAAHMPDELVRGVIEHLPPAGGPWLDAMLEELTPAQGEVFRLMVDMLKEQA
ncbi:MULTISPECIES: MerR family transcriptional regulator [Nonomuraea]|uniref:MerR family transcriptional regulator n=1 Tax=Nonomuraea harbinensis TaxID=1286938 RepID=A0ABW1C501_9ACTN|nr:MULTISPECIES: MerR family transcriptional regulator [Nonomuraea]TXK43240.1 MerR family transcriptional regulator [Nonomuraea sp. C10]